MVLRMNVNAPGEVMSAGPSWNLSGQGEYEALICGQLELRAYSDGRWWLWVSGQSQADGCEASMEERISMDACADSLRHRAKLGALRSAVRRVLMELGPEAFDSNGFHTEQEIGGIYRRSLEDRLRFVLGLDSPSGPGDGIDLSVAALVLQWVPRGPIVDLTSLVALVLRWVTVGPLVDLISWDLPAKTLVGAEAKTTWLRSCPWLEKSTMELNARAAEKAASKPVANITSGDAVVPELVEIDSGSDEIPSLLLRTVPSLLAFTEYYAKEILERFPGTKVVGRMSYPSMAVVEWSSGEYPREALYGRDSFLVLRADGSQCYSVLTDWISIDFPRGTSKFEQEKVFRSHRLEPLFSKVLPFRVRAVVPGTQLTRAVDAARAIRDPLRGIRAHAVLLHSREQR